MPTNKLITTMTDRTNCGACSGCGECCANVLPLSQKEIDTIKQYIKEHGIKEHKSLAPYAAEPVDMTCPFRDNIKKVCTIYEVRPLICRLFKCDQAPNKFTANRFHAQKVNRVVYMREEFFGHGKAKEYVNAVFDEGLNI